MYEEIIKRSLGKITTKDLHEYKELRNFFIFLMKSFNQEPYLYVAFERFFCSYYGIKIPNNLFIDEKAFFDFFRKVAISCNNKQQNIKEIIYKIDPKGSVYFSFATKLLATVDDDLPIYDSKVRIALKLNPIVGKDYNSRVEKAVSTYGKLMYFYNCKNDILEDYNKQFRDQCVEMFNVKFSEYKSISPTKKVDFVLWGMGKNCDSIDMKII